jgi:hypothetical protein
MFNETKFGVGFRRKNEIKWEVYSSSRIKLYIIKIEHRKKKKENEISRNLLSNQTLVHHSVSCNSEYIYSNKIITQLKAYI